MSIKKHSKFSSIIKILSVLLFLFSLLFFTSRVIGQGGDDANNNEHSYAEEKFTEERIDEMQRRTPDYLKEVGKDQQDRRHVQEFMGETYGDKSNIDKLKDGNFRMIHPWLENTKELRDEEDSKRDWKNDSKVTAGNYGPSYEKERPRDLKEHGQADYGQFKEKNDGHKHFMKCFEPRIIQNFCEYCSPQTVRPHPLEAPSGDCCTNFVNNAGERWEYWWPEYEVEINGHGVAAFNPTKHGNARGDLLKEELFKVLSDKNNLPADIKDDYLPELAYEQLIKGDDDTEAAQVKERIKKLSEEAYNEAKSRFGDGFKKLGGFQRDPLGNAALDEGNHAHFYRPKIVQDNLTSAYVIDDREANKCTPYEGRPRDAVRDKENWWEPQWTCPTPIPDCLPGGACTVAQLGIGCMPIDPLLWNGYKKKVTPCPITSGMWVYEKPGSLSNPFNKDCVPPKNLGLCIPAHKPECQDRINPDCFYDTLPAREPDPRGALAGPKTIVGWTEEYQAKNFRGNSNSKGHAYKIWTMPLYTKPYEKKQGDVNYLKKYDRDAPTKIEPLTHPRGETEGLLGEIKKKIKLYFTMGGSKADSPFEQTSVRPQKSILIYTGAFAVGHIYNATASTRTAPTGAAIAARKAMQLFAEFDEERYARKKRPLEMVPIERKGELRGSDKRVFRYTDAVDKMQMVYPRAGGCFRTVDHDRQKESLGQHVPKKVDEGGDLLPFLTEYHKNEEDKELKYDSAKTDFVGAGGTGGIYDYEGKFDPAMTNPYQLGSIRFAFWNKRTACTCPWRSQYTDGVDEGDKLKVAWGCQPWRGENTKDEYIYSIGDGDGDRENITYDKGGDFDDMVHAPKRLSSSNNPSDLKDLDTNGLPRVDFVGQLYHGTCESYFDQN